MRYLVKARVKAGQTEALSRAIADGTLGRGSIAGDEYLYNMETARVDVKGEARWVETCFCDPPLAEERPYWEGYFDLLSVKMRMRVATAVMKTGPSRGHVAIAIARN